MDKNDHLCLVFVLKKENGGKIIAMKRKTKLYINE
jgi:hypothetical protein